MSQASRAHLAVGPSQQQPYSGAAMPAVPSSHQAQVLYPTPSPNPQYPPFSMQSNSQAGPSMPHPHRPPPPFTSADPTHPTPTVSGAQAGAPPAKKRKTKVSAPVAANVHAGPSAPVAVTQVRPVSTAMSAGYVAPGLTPAPPAVVASIATVAGAATAAPVKRPRGRPRKHPLPATQSVPAAASSSLPLAGTIPPAAPVATSSTSALSSSNRVPVPPPTTLKDYVSRLNAHIESTQSRAEGDSDAYLPTGEWSANDKASFYPILARHSTLRPDLIAHETGKNEAQVQQHISALQAQVPAQAAPLRSGRKRRGEWFAGIAPAAREVRDEDIIDEEAAAAELLVAEEKSAEPKQKKKKKGERKLDEAGWGTHLDSAKLSTLSALVRTAIPNDPLTGNKAAKLLRDEQSLAALLLVPVGERSDSQLKEIRRLKDKKTMRMKYRHNKLISEGMTAEEIAAAGGPDAIYLAREGPSGGDAAAVVGNVQPVDPLKGNKHAKIMRDEASLTALLALKAPNRDQVVEVRRLNNKKRARQRIRKRKLLEEGMTEEELADIDIDELFAQRAGIPWGEQGGEDETELLPALGEWVSGRDLDLWNYEMMIGRLGDVQISFEILDQLKTYLLAFLVPLILKVINLAERERGPPNGLQVRLLLEAAMRKPTVPAEVEGQEWEVKSTSTDHEEDELDQLLDEVDEMYDRVQETVKGDWNDPFSVESARNGEGAEVRAKRKEYLALLYKHSRNKTRRAEMRERGTAGRSDIIRDTSESLIGTTDDEDGSADNSSGDSDGEEDEGKEDEDESDIDSQDGSSSEHEEEDGEEEDDDDERDEDMGEDG